MSLFVNLLNGGQKTKKTAHHQKEIDKFTEIEDLLIKKSESLKEKIELELMNARKNLRKNRRAALQALRRKKWYEKHLQHLNCAFKAMKSAHQHIETFSTELIMDVPREEAVTEDMSVGLLASMNQEAEFEEDDLLAELENLEKLEERLEENLSEGDMTDGVVRRSTLFSASPPHPAEMEEDEIEDALEYLRRWASEAL